MSPIVFSNDRMAITHAGKLLTCGWTNAPTMVEMNALESEGRRASAEAGPMAFLNVVFAGVPNFPEPVRAAGARLTRDPLFALGRAHVVLMPGFLGVAVTSFINTFVLLGRPPFPTKIFHALPQATVWLCEKASLQPEEIAAGVETVRKQLQP